MKQVNRLDVFTCRLAVTHTHVSDRLTLTCANRTQRLFLRLSYPGIVLFLLYNRCVDDLSVACFAHRLLRRQAQIQMQNRYGYNPFIVSGRLRNIYRINWYKIAICWSRKEWIDYDNDNLVDLKTLLSLWYKQIMAPKKTCLIDCYTVTTWWH